MKVEPAVTGGGADCFQCAMHLSELCMSPRSADVFQLNHMRAVKRRLNAGDELYQQGEFCTDYFIVIQGWVALRVLTDDGSRHILDFALPGSFLGYQAMVGAACQHSAVCLTPVEVCGFSRAKFEVLLESDADLAHSMMRLLARGQEIAYDHVANMAQRGAAKRLARLLVELFTRLKHALPTTPGENISWPLTQEVMGESVGLTIEHVNRTLRLFREEGIVSVSSRSLRILDPERLCDLAGLSDQTLNYWERCQRPERATIFEQKVRLRPGNMAPRPRLVAPSTQGGRPT